jgi:hypothetical protein
MKILVIGSLATALTAGGAATAVYLKPGGGAAAGAGSIVTPISPTNPGGSGGLGPVDVLQPDPVEPPPTEPTMPVDEPVSKWGGFPVFDEAIAPFHAIDMRQHEADQLYQLTVEQTLRQYALDKQEQDGEIGVEEHEALSHELELEMSDRAADILGQERWDTLAKLTEELVVEMFELAEYMEGPHPIPDCAPNCS